MHSDGCQKDWKAEIQERKSSKSLIKASEVSTVRMLWRRGGRICRTRERQPATEGKKADQGASVTTL